jgi:DNA (cytosine-5)-methyltransferase 1
MQDNNNKKYEVVSLFSGCGGSSLGYKLAGYNILLANEFIPSAREVYKLNFPDTILLEDDIRQLTGKDILNKINKKKGELDLLDGSPPCSSFSSAGRLENGWGRDKEYSDGVCQRTDDLYFEFIRLLRDIQPKVFLSENVPALTQGVSRGYFNMIFKHMQQECGYKVKACVLSSKYFNVAQDRKRLFFMGIRNDISNKYKVESSFPRQQVKRLTTCWDVLKDVNNSEWELKEASYFNSKRILYWLKLLKPGQKGSDIHPNKSYFSLVRIDMSKPSPTVLTLGLGDAHRNNRRSGLCHATENRYLTISELKRISSFPDDFILTGNFVQQWERIARAVPPNLMKSIALHIKYSILDKISH